MPKSRCLNSKGQLGYPKSISVQEEREKGEKVGMGGEIEEEGQRDTHCQEDFLAEVLSP